MTRRNYILLTILILGMCAFPYITGDAQQAAPTRTMRPTNTPQVFETQTPYPDAVAYPASAPSAVELVSFVAMPDGEIVLAVIFGVLVAFIVVVSAYLRWKYGGEK